MDATWKAVLDLVALLLVWAGTAAITFVGVPALVGNPVSFFGQGTAFKGQGVTYGRTPESRAAIRRYWAWATPGFIAITLGVLWQALAPISVLLPDEKLLAVFRQG